jgi:methyl-accepting chemotaxis protein
VADMLPPVIARLVADVGDFVRGMDEAAEAAERAAARIRAAGEAAGNGPDTSHFRDLNAELERLTRTARQAADAIRDHGNASRRAGDDVESLRRRINELGDGMGNAGGSASSLTSKMSPMTAVWALLASIAPGLIAGIFALGAAATGLALAAGVAALGSKGLGQAFDRLQATIKPLQAQLDSLFRTQLGQEFAKLGQTITSQLTPAFMTVARAISDLIKDTTEWIRSSEGVSTIKQAMAGVADLVRELSPAVKGLVQIFLEFAADAAPAMKVIGQAISEVVVSLRDMFREAQKSGQLQRIFEAGAEAIKGFGEILKGVIMILMEMADQGGLPAAEAMKKFGKALQEAAPAIGALFANLARAAEIIATVVELLARLGPALAKIINPIKALQDAFPQATKGMESFTKGAEKIGAVFGSAGKDIDKFVQTVKKGFDKVVQDIKAGADKVVQDIKQWWDKNVATVKAGVDKVASGVKQGFDKVKQNITQSIDRMVQSAKEWWDKTTAAIDEGVAKANQQIKDFCDKIIDDVKQLPEKFLQAGKDMVDGLIKGAQAKADELIKVFKDMAEKALAAVKAALGIHSPSQVFADEVGQHIPGGIAQGIKAGAPALHAALAHTMRTLPMTANVALSGAAGRGAAIGQGGGSGRQVIEVKLDVGSGGDGAMGQAIAGLARRGQLKLTGNAVVGGRR